MGRTVGGLDSYSLAELAIKTGCQRDCRASFGVECERIVNLHNRQRERVWGRGALKRSALERMFLDQARDDCKRSQYFSVMGVGGGGVVLL